MLFLLMQITIAVEESKGTGNSPGVPNVWTEYVKILPRNVPVPTSWSEAERMLLTGTSLEVSLVFLWLGRRECHCATSPRTHLGCGQSHDMPANSSAVSSKCQACGSHTRVGGTPRANRRNSLVQQKLVGC